MTASFFRSSRLVSAVLLAAAVAGCASGNAIDQGVPQAAYPARPDPLPAPAQPQAAQYREPGQPATDGDPVFSGSGQIDRTGEFPNINVEPRGATTQLSANETATRMQQMQSLNAALKAGRLSPAQYRQRLAQLKQLAATASDDSIKKIEN